MCTWLSQKVEYFGIVVRPGQLYMGNKNVGALKYAKFLTIKTQLKSFLGMCNVYRHFVKDFAKRVKPLNALTRAKIPPNLPTPTDTAAASHIVTCDTRCCAPLYWRCPKHTQSSSLMWTPAPTNFGALFAGRNQENYFILPDIGAAGSLVPIRKFALPMANASGLSGQFSNCGTSSMGNGSSSERITKL